MKVRMLASVLEADTWTHREAGEIADLPEAVARDYIRGGIAVLVAEPLIEHAVLAPAETADRPAQRGPRTRK
jgi:hypothetical protein